jgi:hypothetical protein
MIPIPAGVRVWLATGHTDMRTGFASLSLQVQEVLRHDPLSGHLFCFRSRGGDRHIAYLEAELREVKSKLQANHTPPKAGTPCTVAPDGTLLTMDNLPGPETKRWVPSRKAIVVAAVRVGMLSVQEACGRYRLTEEEFAMWQFQADRHGLAGLRTSKGQLYRRS